MKNLNRWFDFPESELKKITKDNYHNVKLKHNIELTLDNVKEFFYDFECNPNYMEGRIEDFRKLNIPNETIISWTTDYYKEDIQRYDSLSEKDKLEYLSGITGILEQFTEPFFIELSKLFLVLLDNPECYQMGPYHFRIGKNLIFYIDILGEYYGFIPMLLHWKHYDLIELMLIKFTNIFAMYPEKFTMKSSHNKNYYYDLLMSFNQKYDLGFESIIEKLK
jgi:hypothetical protein